MNKKKYTIMKSSEFYKDRDFKASKPLLVVRFNIEKETINPVKMVSTKKEGITYIKKLKDKTK